MGYEPFIGEIILFAGAFAPRGWQDCAGQPVSIAQNTALFSILGTTYGGDGITTFKLPDLRGRVPLGQGQAPGGSSYSLGDARGTESVTLTSVNLPPHQHPIPFLNGQESGTAGLAGVSGGTPAGPVLSGASSTPPQPVSVMQPYLALRYIIATEGIYPSRP